MYVARRDRGREVRHRHAARRRTCPIRSRPASAPSTVFVVLRAFASGADGADRRRGDLERRQRLPAPEGQERRDDARRHGRDRDHALPRRLLPRRRDGRTPERERLARLRDRARDFPGRLGRLDSCTTSSRALTLGDPRPRREHVVPGLPAPGRRARARRVLPPSVREPRRPARLLERDHRARGGRGAPDLGLPRRRHLAHPPLRDRRLHGVHALAGGDGPLLAPTSGAGVAASRARQRARRGGDRRRDARRHPDEVRRRAPGW